MEHHEVDDGEDLTDDEFDRLLEQIYDIARQENWVELMAKRFASFIEDMRVEDLDPEMHPGDKIMFQILRVRDQLHSEMGGNRTFPQ